MYRETLGSGGTGGRHDGHGEIRRRDLDSSFDERVTDRSNRESSPAWPPVEDGGGPLFEHPEGADFRFHCPACDASLLVDEQTKDVLIEKGCIICSSPVTNTAFVRVETS